MQQPFGRACEVWSQKKNRSRVNGFYPTILLRQAQSLGLHPLPVLGGPRLGRPSSASQPRLCQAACTTCARPWLNPCTTRVRLVYYTCTTRVHPAHSPSLLNPQCLHIDFLCNRIRAPENGRLHSLLGHFYKTTVAHPPAVHNPPAHPPPTSESTLYPDTAACQI